MITINTTMKLQDITKAIKATKAKILRYKGEGRDTTVLRTELNQLRRLTDKF